MGTNTATITTTPEPGSLSNWLVVSRDHRTGVSTVLHTVKGYRAAREMASILRGES